jgi:hypothetical protein
LCCLYIKPRIKAVCPENVELFEQLTYFINKYSQVGKIIVMGDFNSRTARLSDYIELDGNLLNSDSTCSNILPDTYTIDLEMPPRHNLDKEVNEQGNKLIDLCIETKLRILNERVDGDSLGYNTYYSPRGQIKSNQKVYLKSVHFITIQHKLSRVF